MLSCKYRVNKTFGLFLLIQREKYTLVVFFLNIWCWISVLRVSVHVFVSVSWFRSSLFFGFPKISFRKQGILRRLQKISGTTRMSRSHKCFGWGYDLILSLMLIFSWINSYRLYQWTSLWTSEFINELTKQFHNYRTSQLARFWPCNFVLDKR